MKKIVCFILCALILWPIPAYAATNETMPEEYVQQQLNRYEESTTTEITDISHPIITVSNVESSTIPTSANQSIESVTQLPDYNDGLIANLNAETEIVSYCDQQTASKVVLDNMLSTSDIIISSPTVSIDNAVIAVGDIEIEAAQLESTGSLCTVYSMNGNINLNLENGSCTGIIYAPNGSVTITGGSFHYCGNIIAEDVNIDSTDFTCSYDEDVNYLCNLLNSTDFNLIKDIDDQYGIFYRDLDYYVLAKNAIMANIEGIEYEDIILSDPIEMYDANNVVSNYGFNYTVGTEQGYIVLGAHSKTSLVNIFSHSGTLTDQNDVYCFTNGEIYYKSGDNYFTVDGVEIGSSEFEQYKTEKAAFALNLNDNLLEQISAENLNTVAALESPDFNLSFLGSTHYNGTDNNAYGYGGISNITAYLQDRYGGTATLVDSGDYVSLNTYTMGTISGKSAENCTLVAISRVLYYWKTQKRKTGITGTIYDIYDVVEDIALDYGYSDTGGIFPTKINNVMHDAFEHYGYSSTCNGVYVWSFNNQVCNEIDADRPVVMNILRGYYGNHSVTVAGYCTYKVNNTQYPMIKIVDSWASGYRYIDYNAFAYDMATSGFGSFNTAVVH